MENKTYPKILSNIPTGKDAFKTGSHENIANTIISIIEHQSPIIEKQIIGLEGGWGTGKSNVIRIIEENTDEKFLHFTYDTWTHQEDLTRKSIIQELIFFLRSNNAKIINQDDKEWNKKEDQLSQKIIAKNTEYFPKIKLYYILFGIGLFITKFGNEFFKIVEGNKMIGFYESSGNFLLKHFYFNFSWVYLFKLLPSALFFFALCNFVTTLFIEFKENNKKSDEKKLSFWQVVGKQFYWASGEKFESSSNETVSEKEPTNQKFRQFLCDIDVAIKKRKKTLILTIDNTDRLSGNKLTTIWSTINIFFAESNNHKYLENIWLIIPFDEAKIITNMGGDDGIGLLEKTFAITFKVPPPLLSNWEDFFETAFNSAFKGIGIPKKQEELNLLKSIYANWEKNINPRRIINFINQLTTYYIQNDNIKLRYNAIFILNVDSIFNGNVNDNILDRALYLKNFQSVFIEDKNLEINLARIAFGIKTTEEAKEALLTVLIEKVLLGQGSLNKNLIETSYFKSYFFLVFERFLSKYGADNYELFVRLHSLLLDLENCFSNNPKIYRSLWEKFTDIMAFRNPLDSFTEIQESIIKFCSQDTSIKLIQNHMSFNRKSSNDVLAADDWAEKYYNYLKDLDKFLSSSKRFPFENISLIEYGIDPSKLFEYIRRDGFLFQKYQIKISTNDLKSFLIPSDKQKSRENLKSFVKEVISIKDIYDINFVAEELNNNWLDKYVFTDFTELEALYHYSECFRETSNPIDVTNMDLEVYNSIISLCNSDITNLEKLEYAIFFLITNFDSSLNYNKTELKNILIAGEISLGQDIQENLLSHSPEVVFNIVKMSIEIKAKTIIMSQLATQIFQNKSFVFTEKMFLWILENYSSIVEYLISDETIVYEILNSNVENYDFQIEQVDFALLNNSKKNITERIIEKANIFLMSNMTKYIFTTNNTIETMILIRLIEIDKVSSEVISVLYEPFKNVALSNNNLSDQLIEKILKVRSQMDIKLLLSSITAQAVRVNYKNLGLFGDELYNVIDSLQITLAIKNRLVENLIEKYYSEGLVDYIMGKTNSHWSDSLKKKLKSIESESPVYIYALQHGLFNTNA